MTKSLKKRGQKIFNKVSQASLRAGKEGKDHIKENLIDRISHVRNIKLLILEWGLLVLILILFATTQAFWFNDSYTENAFIDGGIYTEATIGEVNSMNPLFAATNSEKTLSKLMFATLSTNDYSGNAGIGLAESIIATEEGKVWKLKLRNGLKWSDGEPITNDDVIFTIELIKNPNVITVYESSLQGVKVYENEEKEIVFELPSIYADFLSALNIPIVPKHILGDADPKLLLENAFSKSPVTSGAFSFNAVQSGTSAEEKIFYLTSNPYYYKGKSTLNSFAIHTYQDKDEIINALNSNTVTATAELDETDKDKVGASFLRRNSSINSGAFIFFNLSNGPTKDKSLRTAIRRGINLGDLRQKAPGTAALNYPLLSSQIELTNYPEIPAMNFEAAKAKIAEISGGEPIKLNVVTTNSGFLPDVANELKEELVSLGIDASVSVYDEGQDFITNVISKRNYDILIYEIELGGDPDLLPYYHSSQASKSGLNLSNYSNYLVDDLLLGARDTMDQELRVKKYESFLSYWVQDVPSIALYQANLTYFYNKNVRTFSDNVRLVVDLDRFCDISSWAVNKGTRNKTP